MRGVGNDDPAPLIAFAERYLLRNRQAQLEEGMAQTLERIKRAVEAAR